MLAAELETSLNEPIVILLTSDAVIAVEYSNAVAPALTLTRLPPAAVKLFGVSVNAVNVVEPAPPPPAPGANFEPEALHTRTSPSVIPVVSTSDKAPTLEVVSNVLTQALL